VNAQGNTLIIGARSKACFLRQSRLGSLLPVHHTMSFVECKTQFVGSVIPLITFERRFFNDVRRSATLFSDNKPDSPVKV